MEELNHEDRDRLFPLKWPIEGGGNQFTRSRPRRMSRLDAPIVGVLSGARYSVLPLFELNQAMPPICTVPNLLLDPELCEQIGSNARATIISDFNTDAMAIALKPNVNGTNNSSKLPPFKNFKQT